MKTDLKGQAAVAQGLCDLAMSMIKHKMKMAEKLERRAARFGEISYEAVGLREEIVALTKEYTELRSKCR